MKENMAAVLLHARSVPSFFFLPSVSHFSQRNWKPRIRQNPTNESLWTERRCL